MYIENEVYAYCSSVFLFFARMKKMKAALRLTIRTPPTANSHVPFSPVCGRSKPRVLITLIGTIAETEPLSSIIPTASPFTVAVAVMPDLPHTSQITPLSADVITTVIESLRRV